MSDIDDVLSAAWRRAEAMAGKDETRLRELLHPDFVWISHKGDWFDLESPRLQPARQQQVAPTAAAQRRGSRRR